LKYLLSILTILTLGQLPAQRDYIAFDLPVQYGFEDLSQNFIQQDTFMMNFLEKLWYQKSYDNKTVRVLHIGDSHLQADFITTELRTNFHKHFGNAGRGLVVPYKIANTNAPHTYSCTSPNTWLSKRCVFPTQPLPIGVSGLTVQCTDSNNVWSVKVNPYMGLNYSFDRFTLFHLQDYYSFDHEVRGPNNEQLGFIYNTPPGEKPHSAYLELGSKYDKVSFTALRNYQEQNHSTIFGISLENGENGVLYHMVGINGAQYTHYHQAQYFAEQTAVLEPDLIIISLGTNESLDSNLDSAKLSKHIDSLCTALKRYNPDAAILLTTPAASYNKKGSPNTRLNMVRDVIVAYAQARDLCYWDLLNITGNAYNWKQHALLSKDGIHYTKDGYVLQGNLLYHAIIAAYNKHVSVQHP
jgi:lysophospholipase L1-like esterase